MVGQPSYFRQLSNWPHLRSLRQPRLRRAHVERPMDTPSVIVRNGGSKHTVQMLLVQHDHIVETLPAHTTDEPFHIGTLPRAVRRNLHFFEVHVADSLLKIRAADCVPIPEQQSWRCIPRKRFDDLLGGPLGSWVFGHIDRHDAATLVEPA